MITPQERQDNMAEALGIKDLFFKREDLHPYLSHKGRSIPYMINYYAGLGKKSFVISSSGNAALAALMHIQSMNLPRNKDRWIDLDIIVGNNINPEKYKFIKEKASDLPFISIGQHNRPLQTLFEAIKSTTKQPLRQSTDNMALLGYRDLADELALISNLEAVFIGTSSGTTAEALHKHFKAEGIGMEKNGKKNVEIHIVQTSSCHPMAEYFDKVDKDIDTEDGASTSRERAIADAIVDKTALRRTSVIECIQESGGFGWIVSNKDIEEALLMTSRKAKLNISPNSALSVAGLIKALRNGRTFTGAVVCIISGK